MTRAFAANLPRHAFFFAILLALSNSRGAEVGFSRITHAWTNYSTAFNTTHDLSANGEFATVATFYMPPYTVKPIEFNTIVIWSELPPETINFSDFSFSVCFWTSLDAFIGNPTAGDLATIGFVQPSAIALDTVTRGGRPAYQIRFGLTNTPLTLSNCQTYLIGVIARTDPNRSGELYVPTASTHGPSDVQAGNIVPFGWHYLIDAGGLTIYHGQLATELLVERLTDPPRLSIHASDGGVRLSWPSWATCYELESAAVLGGTWDTITNEVTTDVALRHVMLPVTNSARFFRLRTPAREPED